MAEPKRYLIDRLEFDTCKSGAEVARLFSGRLQYPVLTLFTLADLAEVGIDPATATLEHGQPIHCKFWAYYQESEKTNDRGNPYLDILYLEPISPPPQPPGTGDNQAQILLELQEIRKLLVRISSYVGPTASARLYRLDRQKRAMATEDPPAGPDPDRHPSPPAGRTAAQAIEELFDGVDPLSSTPGHLATESPAAQRIPEPVTTADEPKRSGVIPANKEPVIPAKAGIHTLTETEARTRFYELAGPAIAEGRIEPITVNEFTKSANGSGWLQALAALEQALAPTESPQQTNEPARFAKEDPR